MHINNRQKEANQKLELFPLKNEPLEHYEERAKELFEKFRNRSIAFVHDAENRNLIKKERDTGEWEFLSQYLKKDQIAIQVQLGLALRDVEESDVRTQNIRHDLIEKYGNAGLHVAELTMNGIVGVRQKF